MGDQYGRNVGDTMVLFASTDCDEDPDKFDLSEKLSSRSTIGYGRRAIREFIGTYIFLTLAFGVASCAGSVLTNVAIAFGLGLAVAAFLFGCDANPVVSLVKLLLRRGRDPVLFVVMVIVQFVASILAAVTVNYGFGCDISGVVADLGAGVTYGEGLVVEMILTFVLVCAACTQFTPGTVQSAISGIVAGLALLACILVGGGLTGAALNPFRALAPSIFSYFPTDAWIYYVGELIGGVLAALVLVLTKKPTPKGQRKCSP